MSQGTDAADSDPRKRGFATPTRPLRGIQGGPPPRRPAAVRPPATAEEPVSDLVVAPQPPDIDEEHTSGDDQPKPSPPRDSAPTSAPATRTNRPSSGRKVRSADPAENLGTQRGRLKYIGTSLSVEVADRWEHAADTEDLALGEILMRAVKNHAKAIRTGPQGHAPRRRRKGRYPVRKEVSVRPEEAVSIANHARDAGLTASAFMRAVLEKELGPHGKQ